MSEPDNKTVEVAVLNLSGEPVEVGVLEGLVDSNVYFKTNDNEEPIYMSVFEAKMLIAALHVAVHEARGEKG